MKLYLRLLQYARPIEKYAIPYVITTLLGIVFGLLNFAMIIPVLNVLFADNPSRPAQYATSPEPALSSDYIIGLFNYHFYDIMEQYGRMGALQFVLVILVISVLLANVFRYVSARIMEAFKFNTLLKLRQTVFNKVLNLHLGYFSNERKGAIMGKITADVEVIQGSITNTLGVIFKSPAELIGYFVVLFYMSVELTLFTILVIPISGLAIARIVRRIRVHAIDAQGVFGMMISLLDEALGGMRVIKAFNAEKYTEDRFLQENRRYTEIQKTIARRQELAPLVSEFLGVLLVSIIVLYGGSLVLSDNSGLSANEFIAYIAIFSQASRPIKTLSQSWSSIQHGIAAGERVMELIDTPNQITDKPGATEIRSFQQVIAFRDVRFGYNTSEVLKGVSFELPKGKTIALVGPSGGGKSTISDLIPRFYDPQKGTITLDGHDLRDCTLHSIRSMMGIVNQEAILFNDTIYNNIAFGSPQATREQIEYAAKVANAHEFIIATEAGYDTYIGDRGVKLSGGQKQRLSIARAVLRNPPILLLDEATSALDTESEMLVQQALNNLMANRTSLVIAHRLSTIQNADLILVVRRGEIVERGTHAELMANDKGLYRRLQTLQKAGKTSEVE
jgi:subfamily B ATP-binding cassette protein MsbA